jgi:hypothetical protein
MTEGLVALANQEIVEDLVTLGEQLADIIDIAVGTDASGPIGEGQECDGRYSVRRASARAGKARRLATARGECGASLRRWLQISIRRRIYPACAGVVPW